MNEQVSIVMTSTVKSPDRNVIVLERKTIAANDPSVAHVAKGRNRGLIVNKDPSLVAPEPNPAEVSLRFKVYMLNTVKDEIVQESRTLEFWFETSADVTRRFNMAHDYFQKILKSDQFPKDYFEFIKRLMELLRQYDGMRRLQVSIETIHDVAIRNTPISNFVRRVVRLSGEHSTLTMAKEEDSRPLEVVAEEKLQDILEKAFPNALQLEDLVRLSELEAELIERVLETMVVKGIVRQMGDGRWVRNIIHASDLQHEIIEVKSMPSVTANQQPTVAILCLHYCERLAINAMMENKVTFVRYQREGEANAYTLGTIGKHRVVCTKLPTIGRSRSAQISSGNATTRLLGSFQKVEHVLLVGCGGGVPHYTDSARHVRLGDVIVSAPAPPNGDYAYICCERFTKSESGAVEFVTKSWRPLDTTLLDIVEKLMAESVDSAGGFLQYMDTAMRELVHDEGLDFSRPPADADKLYMSVGDDSVVELSHPEGNNELAPLPTIRLGVIGGGKSVVKEDDVRLGFAAKYKVMAFDDEFDQVLESIHGNRNDSYVIIRGISDYRDGNAGREWQPYASLSAAALMKAVIKALPPPAIPDDDN